MKEIDQFRIELSSDDVEMIVQEYAAKKLLEKGYELDYSYRNPGDFYPEVSFRGVKQSEAKT